MSKRKKALEDIAGNLAAQDIKEGRLPDIESHIKALTPIATALDEKAPEHKRLPKLIDPNHLPSDSWAYEANRIKQSYSARQKQVVNRIRKLFADPLFADPMKRIFVAEYMATKAGQKDAAVKANRDYQKLIAQSIPVYGPIEKEPAHFPEDYHEFFTTSPRVEDI